MARLVFADKDTARKVRKVKKVGGWRSVRLLLEPSTRKWWEDPDVVVAFNLPRISAALERLMGTNVVRLTDRNYMKELRERIEEDYRQHLQKRIRARELKELERERILIIEGRTNVIPPELSEDPIFVVNKKASADIQKARAKLKTNREKNSERLKLQGVKWERERLQHEESERARLEVMNQRRKLQNALEEKFKEEDGTAGMNLLRIYNENWRPCEEGLKAFLEQERAKMKERSLRVPTPFSSDPKDIQNIMRNKKKMAKPERAGKRKELIPGVFTASQEKVLAKVMDVTIQEVGIALTDAEHQQKAEEIVDNAMSMAGYNIDYDDFEESGRDQKYLASDDASDMSSGESFEEGSTISMAKNRYALMLQQELERDVAAGLLISKDQYDYLRFEDEKILQLRNARDMLELYQLAEDIIVGERIEASVEDEEYIGEEGVEEYAPNEEQHT